MTDELNDLKQDIQFSRYKDWESPFMLKNLIRHAVGMIEQQYKPSGETTALTGVLARFQEAYEIIENVGFHKDTYKREQLEKAAFKKAQTEVLDAFGFLDTSIRLGALVRNAS